MVLGLALSMLSGMLDGSTVLPLHFVKAWRWENIWLVFCASEMILVPFLAASITLPQALALYALTSASVLLTALAFGVGFGIGNILFGLGVTRVGMGLGNAVVVSFTAVNGSLIPLIFLHPSKLGTPVGRLMLAALAVLVAGIVLCSMAAQRRKEEKALLLRERPNLVTGLAVCVAAGFFSPCVNFAFAFGQPLSAAAVAQGAGEVGSGIAVLVPTLLGAFALSIAYCGYLLTRNRTWADYVIPGTKSHWLSGFLMGCFNGGAFVVYGVATAHMGSMGTVVGWPVYMAMIILTANFWGWLRGEWRGCDRSTYVQLLIGVVLILCAMYLVSRVQ